MLKNNEPQEQLEFLKREEVRTMAKDITLLREEEAKKERDRITKIKTEPAPSSDGAPSRMTGRTLAPPPPQPSLMPHAPEQGPAFVRTRTHPEKILIRVIAMGVFLFILLNGLAFGYWYFTRKQVVEITPEVEHGNGNQVSSGNLVSPTTPTAFFETLQEKTIDLGAADNLAALLSDALKEEHPQGFTRIRLRATGGTAFLTTREFLDRTNVAAPESLLSLLKDDFMLFVYSSPARKRLGVIAELSKTEGAQDILRSWETTLEQDTKPLWEIVGQKGSAYAPFFRQSVHQNTLVRFQTFSVLDFGVVYTLFDTRLILSTSFESVTKAVDLLMQSK